MNYQGEEHVDLYFNVGYTTYLSHTVRSSPARVVRTSFLYKKSLHLQGTIFCFNKIS
jgi:hypothetical protein